MKVVMLLVTALTSSCDLDTPNFAIRFCIVAEQRAVFPPAKAIELFCNGLEPSIMLPIFHSHQVKSTASFQTKDSFLPIETTCNQHEP